MDDRDKWWLSDNMPGYIRDIQLGARRLWMPTLETIPEETEGDGDEFSACAQLNPTPNSSRSTLSLHGRCLRTTFSRKAEKTQTYK